MKKFEEPMFDMIKFSSQDVITTSGDGAIVEGPGMPGGSNGDPFGPPDDDEEV